MLRTEEHPTRRSLIESARTLIQVHGLDKVTVDMVLTESKTSKGSLYHHFKDFDELIDSAQIRTFSRYVNEGISFLERALDSASTAGELKANLFAVVDLGGDPQRSEHRIARARIVGTVGRSLRFSQALAVEQERLRRRGEELIEQAQSKGWLNSGLSAQALSSFIIGFTFGRVLDDVCHERVDSAGWNEIVHLFIDRVVMP